MIRRAERSVESLFATGCAAEQVRVQTRMWRADDSIARSRTNKETRSGGVAAAGQGDGRRRARPILKARRCASDCVLDTDPTQTPNLRGAHRISVDPFAPVSEDVVHDVVDLAPLLERKERSLEYIYRQAVRGGRLQGAT